MTEAKQKNVEDGIDVLKEIPASDIKEFLLSKEGREKFVIDNDVFEKRFIKYIPVQSYDYYYNNLFNDVVLEGPKNERLSEYFELVVDYFSNQMYEEVFKIMKAVIEVYHDTDNMYSKDFIVDIFPKLAMFIRVVFKNCNQELKNVILDWSIDIENNNYYNSIFLRDVIEGIR